MQSYSNIEGKKIALLPHLFLFRVLPDKEPSDLRLQESSLLSLFSEFLKRLDLLDVPNLDSARQAFDVWASLQSQSAELGTIEPERLTTAISELQSGGHLPLFIRELNAALLISVPTFGSEPSEQTTECDNNGTRTTVKTSVVNGNSSLSESETLTAVISTFPASLPTLDVVMPVAAPIFVYPTTSMQIPYSLLLESKEFAEQICRFDTTQQISTTVSLNIIFK